jgi:multiple antibiotic resistance protein
MVLAGKANIPLHYGILIASIIVVLALTYFILVGADKLSHRLGTTWVRVIQRIMGILLMVIAVQFIIDGATSVLKSIIISALE